MSSDQGDHRKMDRIDKLDSIAGDNLGEVGDNRQGLSENLGTENLGTGNIGPGNSGTDNLTDSRNIQERNLEEQSLGIPKSEETLQMKLETDHTNFETELTTENVKNDSTDFSFSAINNTQPAHNYSIENLANSESKFSEPKFSEQKFSDQKFEESTTNQTSEFNPGSFINPGQIIHPDVLNSTNS